MTLYETRTHDAIQSVSKKINEFTLRDYFAGQALAGILTNIEHDFGENPHEHIAKICYEYADALLEQRKNCKK